MSTILLTGARGGVGSLLAAHWRDREATPLDLPDDLFQWSGKAEIIVHCAVDWTEARVVTAMTRHLIANAEGLKRFVLCSSITVDPACGLTELDHYHVAEKVAAEAWADAWAKTTGQTAIAMRLGLVSREPHADANTEALRLTSRGLCWWMDRALREDVPAGRLTTWICIGDGARLSAAGIADTSNKQEG